MKYTMEQLSNMNEKGTGFRGLTGLRVLSAGDGHCIVELEIEEKHLNPLGTVHGGCLYTLADEAGGIASATAGGVGPTISGDMYFMRSLVGAKHLRAEARLIKAGKRIRVAEVVITDEKGNEACKCVLQYMDLGLLNVD